METPKHRRQKPPWLQYLPYLQDFLKESCKPDPSRYIKCNDLYRAYKASCSLYRCRIIGERIFDREVGHIFPTVERKRIRLEGIRTMVYLGLASTRQPS